MIVCFACTTPKPATGATGAKFIFRATVERVAAATLPEISDVSNCIVVKVSEVVSAPPGFTDWTGKSITVAVRDINSQKPETEKLFYTNGWLYGQSLAVVEVHSTESREVSNEEVLAGVNKAQDDGVRERLKRAALVISGEVVRLSDPEKQPVDSEHDPYWVTAEIQTEEVLKGSAEGSTITFRFPSSYDIMWQYAPKFKVGDKGIWLLQRAPNQETIFSITEEQDFYPIERKEYIQSLLK